MPRARPTAGLVALLPLPSIAGVIAACTEELPPPVDSAPRELPQPEPDGGDLDRPDGAPDALAPPTTRLGFLQVSTGPLTRPIEIAARAGRLYVAEHFGTIRLLGPDGSTGTVVLDIEPRITKGYDQGILGFTFHPDFPDTPYLYVTYTSPHPDVPAPPNVSFQSVIARYESSDGGLTFDADTEKRILVWDHPGVNHNNNSVLFGPDGYLYISSGDGADPTDLRFEHAQRTDVLLGKMLRIDVDNGDPYAIPPSNPFADGGGLPEIFALGLRNPWRFDFDAESKRLFAGDVGQYSFEEINEIVLGGNYGWGAREGYSCFDGGPGCDGTFIDPLIVHGRAEATAIVGGVVYHGTKIPELTGKYVYSDTTTGFFWAAAMDSPAPEPARLLDGRRMHAVSIRLDEDGEILVVEYGAGKIWRMTLEQVP